MKHSHGEASEETAIVVVREMDNADVPAILLILKESPGASKWPEEGLLEAARSGPVWVAEQEGNVIGAVIGRAAADEFEILNLVVAQSHRRRGVATQLLKTMAAWVRMSGTNRVYLEVRASNDAAIVLYAKHGFRPCGRRARYYQYPVEDAIVLAWEINATP